MKKDSRHFKLARTVLDDVTRKARNHGLLVLHDAFPFHVIVTNKTRYVSFWCGGFDKRIYVQPLRKNGEPDNRYKESSFLTPKGAVNYVSKFFERKSKQ